MGINTQEATLVYSSLLLGISLLGHQVMQTACG